MVTQEDGPTDVEVDHQRRSLTAAAIRRGEVKISEPILWVEGVPENNTALQRPISTVVPQDSVFLAIEEADGDLVPGIAVSTDNQGGTSGDADLPVRRELSSHQLRETVKSQNLSTFAESMDQKSEHKRSIFVESEMGSPSPGSQEKKKKARRSGLSAVFRKVFGRKEKRLSKVISPPQSRAGPKHEYTRSVS